MARNEAHQSNAGSEDSAAGIPGARGRRKAVRYAVPVAVAGVAAASIGIGSALASSGDPDLPKISAEELIAKVAESDVQRMSGSVKFSTDLGLPSLPSGISLGGGAKGGEGKDGDVSPQAKLTELASGTHTLRVAVDGPDKQRLSIVERAAEYSLIRNGDQVWAYDSGSNTVHHSTAPHDKAGKSGRDAKGEALHGASPQELAKKALDAVGDSTSVAVDGTAKVAGRDAYQLTVKPKAAESTVGAVRIAVDAKTGTPLKFTLAAKSGGKPVVDAAFTKVDFGRPSASTFDFTPPKGAKVTEDKDFEGRAGHKGARPGEAGGMPGLAGLTGSSGAPGFEVLGKDWASIAHFTVPKDLGKAADKAADKGAGKAGGAGKSAPDGGLFEKFGSKVSGPFGSGQIFSTRLVNALITDDGEVYVGAVTKDALVAAAK
ncbi:membrane protein [Streptomyces eurocidicus]|uniref:Membrane protein n=1 Tax=Streptomyces eurocidicus TaxID=66423 RepID=A0A2N8NS51_STREU|nr:DUF2092 domain-containing protein [Streptomyces eurocidicus]MBB5122827.1 outer membrane lipoprotein-sorting protein [Streptomyces eurocidicus]MBF6054285.1 DUF2092 domain-containing protein [Streptomyces eurocidicus]PNE31588.1 membrane protein [Streptomyces eurocidicus]